MVTGAVIYVYLTVSPGKSSRTLALIGDPTGNDTPASVLTLTRRTWDVRTLAIDSRKLRLTKAPVGPVKVVAGASIQADVSVDAAFVDILGTGESGKSR